MQQRLEACKVDLRRWNWQKYGSIEKSIKEKTKQLEILQSHEGATDGQEIKKL